MENRMTIVAKDGKAEATVLVGSHFHTLEDRSCLRYSTSDIRSYVDYLERFKGENAPGVVPSIFFSRIGAELFFTPVTKESVSVATLQLISSTRLKGLLGAANAWTPTKQFHGFLKGMLSCMQGSSGRELIKHVEDMKIQKTESIEQKKDSRGNFHYQVTTQSGVNDMDPPAKVSFKVPIYENLEDSFEVDFDVWFDYTRDKENVTTSWRLENMDFAERLNQASRGVVEKRLKETGLPLFFGEGAVHAADNKWTYLANTAQ